MNEDEDGHGTRLENFRVPTQEAFLKLIKDTRIERAKDQGFVLTRPLLVQGPPILEYETKEISFNPRRAQLKAI